MDNAYTITWQGTQNNILRIYYGEDITWADVLKANLEALEIISEKPYDAVLFNDSDKHSVDKVNIGAIKELLFNKLPEAPKNLKGVVILAPPSQKIMLEIGIETVANVRYGRNFIQVVDNYETADRLLLKKLGEQG